VGVLNGAVNLATNITYKPFGGVSFITYGNGLTGSITYDTQYRLATLATGTFQNLTYGYDYNGNITSITPGKTYTYDALDRLWTANGPWGSLGWIYDGVGNRQTEGATVYSYFQGTNKLSGAGGTSFGYDNNGNTTSETARSYAYNQNQRLIQAVNGATTANYTYNGNGQRVKKVVNGTTTIFHYSLSGQIIGESDSAGTIIAEYVYLNGQPLAKLEGVNTYYYHNDHLATPQKMTDSSGTVVWSADYKPFGEATVTVSTITNNLRFPGQYFDAETGLNYNLNRDYNPPLGRYTQADPIGLSGGDVNVYRYVMNNPVANVDENGLLCKNKKSNNYVWTKSDGTDMPTGAAFKALACIEKCMGKGNPWSPYPSDNGTSCSPYDLKITGGSECTPFGSHIPGSKIGSKHCSNQAFDLPLSDDTMTMKCCAKKCGVTYIQLEDDHLHLQTEGGGKKKNILPNDKDCCSIK
jgi:RHS repeat-associated protein